MDYSHEQSLLVGWSRSQNDDWLMFFCQQYLYI